MKKKPIVLLLVVCLTFFSVFLVGCDFAAKEQKQVNSTSTDNSIYEYGNGVYYISGDANTLGEKLSQFIADHPKLEVVTISGNGTGVYGKDLGLWVVCKNK